MVNKTTRRIVRTAKKQGSVPRSKIRKAVKNVKGKDPIQEQLEKTYERDE